MEDIKSKAFKKPNYVKYQEPILDDEFIERVCNFMRAGAYIETAVVVAGASKATFYRWMQIANGKFKPKAGEGPPSDELVELCVRLQDAVEKASEEATLRDLMIIDAAATGKPPVYERDEDGKLLLDGKGNPIVKIPGQRPDWSASAWRLERRKPKEWSRTEKQEVSIKENNLTIEFVDPSEEVTNENED